jgi:YD repeat-containing protein
VTYGYGADLRNQVATIAYPNNVGTVTQTWNDDGTLVSVEDWNSKTTTFGYDANANETSQVVPSTTNVTDTFGYNAADEMTSVSDSNGSSLFSASYGRDSNGQLSSDSSQASNQANYKYTSLSQLCYAGSGTANACTSPPASSYPYAFDSADNLTTNNGTTQKFDTSDQLCWTVSRASANACGSPPGGSTTFNYDTRGNRTSQVVGGAGTCDTFDHANRLTQIQTGTGSSCTSPSTVGTYSYDGSGVRESKAVSGTTTQYTWGGLAALAGKGRSGQPSELHLWAGWCAC